MINFAYLIFFIICAFILFHKKLIGNNTWRATITPLGSIIGCGFLISAPILNKISPNYAFLLMLILCTVTFGIGQIIRWNIINIEDNSKNLFSERLSEICLTFAYILSGTYYLSLLGAFNYFKSKSFAKSSFSFLMGLICLTIVVLGIPFE